MESESHEESLVYISQIWGYDFEMKTPDLSPLTYMIKASEAVLHRNFSYDF